MILLSSQSQIFLYSNRRIDGALMLTLQVTYVIENKYSKVAERVVSIALESVDFNEERAEQILMAVEQEEETPKATATTELKDMRRPDTVELTKGVSPVEQRSPPAAPVARRLKTWTEHLKYVLA
ncbi:jg2357 [Pararge aegeria aegeria]|uniref:Jg2357 protein n=1 Tax=Pararge aegeria aegeria TaxID=348720 RepID=A0A8S4QWW9_9NEOP|nr:jg2357 [Pararge aegeria aegeria]